MSENTKDVGFYNAQDGVKGRDGGPYLDYVERYNAEVVRAQKEDREAPEFGENVPAHVGTSLVTAPLVVDNSNTSNPSMAAQPGLEVALADDTFTENEHLADPLSVLPVDFEGRTDGEDSADVGDGDTQQQGDVEKANPDATLVEPQKPSMFGGNSASQPGPVS